MASWNNNMNRVCKSQSLNDLTMLGRRDSIGLEEYKVIIRGALSEENLMEVHSFCFQKKEEDERKTATTSRDLYPIKREEMGNFNKRGKSAGYQAATETLVMKQTIGEDGEGDRALYGALREDLLVVGSVNKLGNNVNESEDGAFSYSEKRREIQQLFEQDKMITKISQTACDKNEFDNQQKCMEFPINDNEPTCVTFGEGLNAVQWNATDQEKTISVNGVRNYGFYGIVSVHNDSAEDIRIDDHSVMKKVTIPSIRPPRQYQLTAFDLLDKDDDEISLGEFSPRKEKKSSLEKLRTRLALKAKSKKGRGNEVEKAFDDVTYRHNEIRKPEFPIKRSDSQTNLVKIENSGILRKEKYKKMCGDKKKKRVSYSKHLPRNLRVPDSGGQNITECGEESCAFDDKEVSNDVFEEDDRSKMIDVVAKRETKKGNQQMDKRAEEEKEAKYAAKLKKEHLKLEKKIIKREEKEKKRMRKKELKLAKKQGSGSKEVGCSDDERLENAKCKAKEEKIKMKEEKKKAKEHKKFADKERKRELEETKRQMKLKENEEKEEKKAKKERKYEELRKVKEIHAAFLKEKKQRDEKWKLAIKRGDNKERVKELRKKEVKNTTNEEIFMASSVKRIFEEISKEESVPFKKPIVAWG